MEQLFTAIGVGTNDLLWAFLGAACGAFALTQPRWKSTLVYIFIGTCVGSCAAPNMMALSGKPSNNFLTLVVGSIGPPLLLLGGDWIKKRIKLNLNGKENGA
jgi:hypothetical protein